MSIQDDSRTTKGITHEQRYYLCLKKHQCPSMKQSELAEWFKEQFNFPISQPAISHSLKRSNEILSGGPSMPGVGATSVRKRPVRHPELELALYQWAKSRQGLEDQDQANILDGESFRNSNHGNELCLNSGEPITGPVLLRQAKRIAQEMNITDIVFCPGWLSRFKARYGLKTVDRDTYNSRNMQYNCSRNKGFLTSSSSHVGQTFQGNMLVSSSDMRYDKGSNDIHPSIPVPASIDNSHTPLHQHHTPSDLPSLSANLIPHHQQPLEIQKQHQEQRRDTQFIHQHRRHPYCSGSSTKMIHGLTQRSIILEDQPNVTPSTPPIDLAFLQSIPIASSSSSNSGNNSISPIIPLSIDNDADSLRSSPSTKINIQTLSPALIPQSLHEAQQYVHQIRHYVKLHLQDPTTALQSLVTLERELEFTKTRQSITISEVDEVLN